MAAAAPAPPHGATEVRLFRAACDAIGAPLAQMSRDANGDPAVADLFARAMDLCAQFRPMHATLNNERYRQVIQAAVHEVALSDRAKNVITQMRTEQRDGTASKGATQRVVAGRWPPPVTDAHLDGEDINAQIENMLTIPTQAADEADAETTPPPSSSMLLLPPPPSPPEQPAPTTSTPASNDAAATTDSVDKKAPEDQEKENQVAFSASATVLMLGGDEDSLLGPMDPLPVAPVVATPIATTIAITRSRTPPPNQLALEDDPDYMDAPPPVVVATTATAAVAAGKISLTEEDDQVMVVDDIEEVDNDAKPPAKAAPDATAFVIPPTPTQESIASAVGSNGETAVGGGAAAALPPPHRGASDEEEDAIEVVPETPKSVEDDDGEDLEDNSSSGSSSSNIIAEESGCDDDDDNVANGDVDDDAVDDEEVEDDDEPPTWSEMGVDSRFDVLLAYLHLSTLLRNTAVFTRTSEGEMDEKGFDTTPVIQHLLRRSWDAALKEFERIMGVLAGITEGDDAAYIKKAGELIKSRYLSAFISEGGASHEVHLLLERLATIGALDEDAVAVMSEEIDALGYPFSLIKWRSDVERKTSRAERILAQRASEERAKEAAKEAEATAAGLEAPKKKRSRPKRVKSEFERICDLCAKYYRATVSVAKNGSKKDKEEELQVVDDAAATDGDGVDDDAVEPRKPASYFIPRVWMLNSNQLSEAHRALDDDPEYASEEDEDFVPRARNPAPNKATGASGASRSASGSGRRKAANPKKLVNGAGSTMAAPVSPLPTMDTKSELVALAVEPNFNKIRADTQNGKRKLISELENAVFAEVQGESSVPEQPKRRRPAAKKKKQQQHQKQQQSEPPQLEIAIEEAKETPLALERLTTALAAPNDYSDPAWFALDALQSIAVTLLNKFVPSADSGGARGELPLPPQGAELRSLLNQESPLLPQRGAAPNSRCAFTSRRIDSPMDGWTIKTSSGGELYVHKKAIGPITRLRTALTFKSNPDALDPEVHAQLLLLANHTLHRTLEKHRK